MPESDCIMPLGLGLLHRNYLRAQYMDSCQKPAQPGFSTPSLADDLYRLIELIGKTCASPATHPVLLINCNTPGLRPRDPEIRAQTSTWRRKNASPRPLSLQAVRSIPSLTSGATASSHPGQLPAVRPARGRSPAIRRPRLECPGRENWAAGSAVAGGKCGADDAAPIGQARPRSAAPAEPPSAAGRQQARKCTGKEALAGAERAGNAPAHLDLASKLCVLASLKPVRLLPWRAVRAAVRPPTAQGSRRRAQEGGLFGGAARAPRAGRTPLFAENAVLVSLGTLEPAHAPAPAAPRRPRPPAARPSAFHLARFERKPSKNK